MHEESISGAVHGGAEKRPLSRLEHRQRAVVWAAVATAVVSLAGLAASTLVRSPAQQLADTTAPAANVLTAVVQRTVLTSTVVVRGTFTAAHETEFTPTSVAATDGNPAGGSLIVTAVHVAQGGQVTAGTVLLEYSGRPVFALPGAVPAYRDMQPGESGPDIAELQRALAQLGYPCRDRAGYFGEGTKDAVARYYAHLGYPVPTTGAATAQAVRAAQQSYDQQYATVTNLKASQGARAAGTGSTQLAQAEQALKSASTALEQAEKVDGPMVPMSEALFLPAFPAYVDGFSAQVGDPVAKPLLTLSDGGLNLTARLDPSEAGLVKAGTPVQVLSETTGLQAEANVAAVGSVTTGGQPSDAQATSSAGTAGQDASISGANDTGAAYVPVSVTPQQPWNPAFDGQDVRITITAASTAGPVLAVPEAAISTGADARTTVTVLEPSGGQRQVQVQAGVSADGLVEVTPLGSALVPGEHVVVGK